MRLCAGPREGLLGLSELGRAAQVNSFLSETHGQILTIRAGSGWHGGTYEGSTDSSKAGGFSYNKSCMLDVAFAITARCAGFRP